MEQAYRFQRLFSVSGWGCPRIAALRIDWDCKQVSGNALKPRPMRPCWVTGSFLPVREMMFGRKALLVHRFLR